MHLSIVIPTYKEHDNLKELIPKIDSLLTSRHVLYNILIVDDASDDGSEELISSLSKIMPVAINVRRGVRGLSSAVFDGIVATEGDVICFMDADLSHPPEALSGMFDLILHNTADLVVGSRLVKGGGMGQWPWYRRFTSWGARMLARPLTSIKDVTSGFFMFKRSAFPQGTLNLEGFKLGLEILVKGNYKRAHEYPIVFHDRVHGQSKLSGKVMTEYLKQLAQLYRYKLFKSTPDKPSNRVLQ